MRASITRTWRSLSAEFVCGCIARRKLSTVTSKCTNARLRPSRWGMSVAFAITHSLVSGDTYGAVWCTRPKPSANVGAKKTVSSSLVDRSAGFAMSPRTARANSSPCESMKQASPMAVGYRRSR